MARTSVLTIPVLVGLVSVLREEKSLFKGICIGREEMKLPIHKQHNVHV